MDDLNEDVPDSLWGHFQQVLRGRSGFASYEDKMSDDKLSERDVTSGYYDLATDFYEYGWGSSFHFASRYRGESREASILRHEHFLAMKLGLKPSDQVGDLGMGVGGPLRNIAKFSGATITGVSINEYQVRRAKKLTQQRESTASASRMKYVHGDYTKLVPQVFQPESLDAVYYIESACHISNRTEIFLESARALKKGGKLFNYEWVMTDRFDASNLEHVDIKKGIEWGNGIENLIPYREPVDALAKAGFKVLEHGDLVEEAEQWYGKHNVPWYHDMDQSWSFSSISQFQLSQFGQHSLSKLLWLLEKLGVVPAGASQTEAMLRHGGERLVKGGRQKIFTPMHYIVAEKV